MFTSGAFDALNHFRFGPANAKAAARSQQVDTLTLLEIIPAFKRAAYKRYIRRVFVIRLANNARVAMGAALVVNGYELFQREHVSSTPSQLGGCSRAHAPDSNHDDVKIARIHELFTLTIDGLFSKSAPSDWHSIRQSYFCNRCEEFQRIEVCPLRCRLVV
jgi:hypothetical protein